MSDFCCELPEELDLCFSYAKICWPCSFLIFAGLVITDVMILLYDLDVTVGGIICLVLLSFICLIWNILYPIAIWDWIKKERMRQSSLQNA